MGSPARKPSTPAITVEADEVASYWADLGSRWLIMEQGFKPHAVCWWAQPAIEGTLNILRQHSLAPAEIAGIEVKTFEKATRLAHPRPATTEEAQYSLPYPVAAAVLAWADRGTKGWDGVGPTQLLEDNLHNEQVLALAERVRLIEAPDITARFPGRFLARVTVKTNDGRQFESGETTFRGEQDFPFSDDELRAKYRWLAGDILSPERVAAIEAAVFDLPNQPDIQLLLDCLTPSPDNVSEA